MFLPRDSSAGHGQDDPLSRYRHVDVFDIAGATDVHGRKYDVFNASIASDDGVVHDGIKPVTFCSWLDFNVNSELGKFGLHNGGEQDAGLLNEKWEGLALAPVGGHNPDEYFLFASSDNDFITQDGFMNGGKLPYKDASGFNLDNQVLVFRVTLPKGAKPLVS
ncbi:hypothetical protein VTK73DRAFT_2551 [Phialemonium thermophilum]|uniref:Phytase-like domain-containing protein n=1 Tax=Phialemonium thermophilum TaxID=223376 RepID=A0ABR3VS05_9PEZI